jgi:hypothetical protein
MMFNDFDLIMMRVSIIQLMYYDFDNILVGLDSNGLWQITFILTSLSFLHDFDFNSLWIFIVIMMDFDGFLDFQKV